MYIKVEKLRDSWGFEYFVPIEMVGDFFKLYSPDLPKEFKDKFFGMECCDFTTEEFFTKTENDFEKLYPKEIEVKMFINNKYYDWDYKLFIPESILEEYEGDVILLRNGSMEDGDFIKKYSDYEVDFFNSVYQKVKK